MCYRRPSQSTPQISRDLSYSNTRKVNFYFAQYREEMVQKSNYALITSLPRRINCISLHNSAHDVAFVLHSRRLTKLYGFLFQSISNKPFYNSYYRRRNRKKISQENSSYLRRFKLQNFLCPSSRILFEIYNNEISGRKSQDIFSDFQNKNTLTLNSIIFQERNALHGKFDCVKREEHSKLFLKI